jgi:agmatinase
MNFLKNSHFVACNNSFKESKTVIAGLPYDGTSSFRPGSRFAPESIRNYSYAIETFSHEQEKDLTEYKFGDLGNLELPLGSSEAVLTEVENLCSWILENNKKAIYLGGEHLLTYPIMKQYYKKYKDLKVIYFDAHADFREEFTGSRLSHACAAKLTTEIIGDENIFMFGIRSFEKNEWLDMKKRNIFVDHKVEHFNEVVEKIKGYPVYMSLDMDVFDPACLPALGTPEAGGMFYRDFINLLPGLSKLNIVGLDVLEISPEYDSQGNSSIFAAKVVRELLLNTAEK